MLVIYVMVAMLSTISSHTMMGYGIRHSRRHRPHQRFDFLYPSIPAILRTGLRTNELRELLVSDISAYGEILTYLEVRAEISHDKKEREIPIPNDEMTTKTEQLTFRFMTS